MSEFVESWAEGDSYFAASWDSLKEFWNKGQSDSSNASDNGPTRQLRLNCHPLQRQRVIKSDPLGV